MGFALSTVVIIVRSQSLRSRYYYNCLHIAIANLISATSIVSVDMKRLILALTKWGEVSFASRCALDIGAIDFGSNTSICQNFCLALDRLLAVTVPIFYKTHYEQYGYLLSSFIWLLTGTLSVIHGTVGTNSGLIPLCSKPLVYQPWDISLQEDIQIFAVVLIVVANILVIIAAWRRNKQKKILNSAKQMRLVKAMSYAVLSDLIIWIVINQVFNRIVFSYSTQLSVKVSPYNQIVFTISPVLNFICYTAVDLEFRKALMSIRAVGYSVAPISFVSSHH